MPQVISSQLQVNQPIEGAAPDATLVINIDPNKPLPVGTYLFQLEVVDDSGNRSKAVQAKLVILDDQAPTAVISAPPSVPFGKAFTLSGQQSQDTGGGKISKFIWTLVQ
jgi:hypothetical protein